MLIIQYILVSNSVMQLQHSPPPPLLLDLICAAECDQVMLVDVICQVCCRWLAVVLIVYYGMSDYHSDERCTKLTHCSYLHTLQITTISEQKLFNYDTIRNHVLSFKYKLKVLCNHGFLSARGMEFGPKHKNRTYVINVFTQSGVYLTIAHASNWHNVTFMKSQIFFFIKSKIIINCIVNNYMCKNRTQCNSGEYCQVSANAK